MTARADSEQRKGHHFPTPGCPPDRLPTESETIFSRGTRPDYVIDANGCWVWQKALIKGYATGGKNQPRRAARLYYLRANGPGSLAPDQDVHHVCPGAPNTACVNPDHLEAIDGLEHRIAHRHAERIFTAGQLAEIARMVKADDLTVGQMAERLGVGRTTLQKVLTGERYPESGIADIRPERACLWCGEPVPASKYRNARFCSRTHRGNYNSAQSRARAA